jgi:hypothetical protein
MITEEPSLVEVSAIEEPDGDDLTLTGWSSAWTRQAVASCLVEVEDYRQVQIGESA